MAARDGDVVRLELKLAGQAEWLQLFDPRDWTVAVATGLALAPGAAVRIELDVGGWLVTLRGDVVRRRDEPAGVVVAVGAKERDKINYLNGYVRGGLLNLRGRRRLPVRLAVTYGAIEGPAQTYTKDFNEEGLFLLSDAPLPETAQLHMLVTVPGRPQPLSLVGKVTHVVAPGDDDEAGMGVAFELDAAQRALLDAVVRTLEQPLAPRAAEDA